jgi:hypothetical protein
MCLSKVTESYEPPCSVITDGWKDIDPKKPSLQFTINGKSAVPLDVWISATAEHAKDGGGGKIKADDGILYEPGFHAYAEEPKKGKKTRVFLRNILCQGEQDYQKVVVAREMYIPSDPNGWPPKDDDEPQSGGGNKPRSNPIKKMIDKTIADMKGMGVTPGQA